MRSYGLLIRRSQVRALRVAAKSSISACIPQEFADRSMVWVAGLRSFAMAVRRSPWINEQAQLLVALLDERYGFVLSEDDARVEVSDHVDHVGALMGVGRAAAKFYVTAETISELSDRIGREIRRKQDQQAHPSAARHLKLVHDQHPESELSPALDLKPETCRLTVAPP